MSAALATIATSLNMPVFPCSVKKTPAISKHEEGGRSFLDATTDPVEIARLFSHRRAKLIGVPMGPLTGFDALDFDYRNGARSWEEANAHRLPETRVHQSQSGGRHLIFRHAPGVRNSESSIAQGIDVRGDGGYLIWPPSTGYTIISDAEPVEWPDWLLAEILPKVQPATARPPSEPRQPISAARIERIVSCALDKVRAAADGQKHFTLRNQALLLGGIQHYADFSNSEAVQWLVDALPSTVRDRKLAEKTAIWGVENGARNPIEIEDRRAPSRREEPPPHPGSEDNFDNDDALVKRLESIMDGAEDRPSPARPNEPLAIQVVNGHLAEAVTAGEAALIRAESGIYQRSVFLVRPGIVMVKVASGAEVPALRSLVIGEAGLTEAMTSASPWEVYDKRSEDWVRKDCPAKVVKALRDRVGRWKLPVLAGIINAPTLRADGSILSTPGYDATTGLLFDTQGICFPEVPLHPTKEDAEAAIDILDKLVDTFPFVGEADRAVALSAMLTATIRVSLPTAPMHCFDAPVAGSGKSKLVDMCSIMVTGREAGVIAQGRTEEEMEKRLGAHLLAGDAVIAIDNCEHPLGGEFLCQVLTQTTVRARILGKSETPELPSNAFITANGNNLTLIGDVTRRSLMARLDPKCERPELRTFTQDPIAMLRADRGKYLIAGLTVLRAFHVAGRPAQSKPLGSFELWSGWVRDALIWCGHADPVGTMEAARAADPRLSALTAVFEAWNSVIGSDEVSVKDVIEKATDHSYSAFGKAEFTHPQFREALLVVAGAGGAVDSDRLGKWLRQNKNRVIGRRSLIRAGDIRGGVAAWQLRPA